MESRKLSRRTFLKLGSAVGAATALAACAPTAAPTQAPAQGGEAPAEAPAAAAGPVTLEYWFCWSGIYQDKQRAILDTFEKEAGTIKINDVTVPANIRDKMLTAVAADQSPDAAACFGDVVSLAARGGLLDISEYVKASKILQLDALYQPRVEATFWNGKQWGLPYNCSAELPLYNRGMMEAAGLDVEKQIETWDELTEVSKQLVKFDDSGNLEIAAYTDFIPRHPSLWFWINGGDAYDAVNQTVTIDRPENVEGLQTIIDYAWNVYGDIAKADDFNAGSGSAQESPFCTQTKAIVYAGDWDPSTYNEWCPGIGLWPQLFPGGPKGAPLASNAGDFITVLRGSKHPAEAYQFVEWMVMKGNKMWTEAGVDTNCVIADAGIVRADWPSIFGDKAGEVAKWWAEQASSSKAVENFPAYGFMRDELARVMDLALHKQMTAGDALAEAQKTVSAEADKFLVG